MQGKFEFEFVKGFEPDLKTISIANMTWYALPYSTNNDLSCLPNWFYIASLD